MSALYHNLRNLIARHSIAWLGLMLFGLALAVRLYRLDAQSLWLDEGSSWQMAGQPWGGLLLDLLRPNAAYPLYHLLLKGWTTLFGDSELALRLPSALAGAAAVTTIGATGRELERLGLEGDQGPGREIIRGNGPAWPVSGLAAATIALLGPFAIWYSQEAKAYSLLLLATALLSWALLRALRRGERSDWLLLGALCLAGLFLHRLAALTALAALAAALADQWRRLRPADLRWGATLALALAAAGLVVAMGRGLGSDRAATGAYIPAGPLSALGLTFSRFSLDRWPGDMPWWWLLPWAGLVVFGLAGLLRDLRGPRRRGALSLLLLLGVPTAIFLAQLLLTRLYEARYLIVMYPAWCLLLAYPLRRRAAAKQPAPQASPRNIQPFAPISILLGSALLTGVMALFQPVYGIFSGDPVKEQYREAIGALAARVHPDDAVVIHPSYIRPLYNYYMRRFSADPAPAPIGFADFWQGETAYGQREWDSERSAALAGHTRSFLLIAPEHAKTVDRPDQAAGDEYGLVGNYWRFSREQGKWPCGIWRYNGAHLLCQESPEVYVSGVVPRPATPDEAVFGDNLRLLGHTFKATTPAGPGVYRAGGSLPISLFWDVAAPPAADLSMFLHLCQACDSPPAAGEDGPPLEGYLPTSSWLPGKPARDDRAISLPADLPPGHYTLLLGVYRPDDPSEAGRLAVNGARTLGSDRLVLGTVEIVAADGT